MSQKIKHLYNRAGFGLSPNEWHVRKKWSVSQGIDELFSETEKTKLLDSYNVEDFLAIEKDELPKYGRKLANQQKYAWLDRMSSTTKQSMLERLCLFWHGHFSCRSRYGHLLVNQLNVLRTHALGSFRDLCLAIARDPAMIRYLNNQQNKKESPNENFARELLELFTIGPGYYTEQDIKEAARAFTGWGSNKKGDFVFRKFFHDEGQKTFMGVSGNLNGEDIIKIVLDRPETATFLVRKFWRYYVSVPFDEKRIAALSKQYYDSDYNTGNLLRSILSSDWFYEERYIGKQVKSPVVLIVGLRRLLDIHFYHKYTQNQLMHALGQVLYNPPNVAGWPGGEHWINNATLSLRLNLGAAILTQEEVDLRFQKKPEMEEVAVVKRMKLRCELAPLLELIEGGSNHQAFYILADYLLSIPTRFSPEDMDALLDKSAGEERLRRILLIILSLPEYQMC